MSEKWRLGTIRWQKKIIVGCLWFAFCDFHSLGFGVLSPFRLRLRNYNGKTMVGVLKDSTDNYPKTLEVPIPRRNATALRMPSPPMFTAPGLITQEKLQHLQETINLVSVIQSYGLPQFKRSGEHRATCLCPFHDDHNPSLSIDGARGIYKCFSCGAGGNIFTFVREYAKSQGEEVSFYQAVELVNDRFASGNGDFTIHNLPHGMRQSIRDSTANKTANDYAALASSKSSSSRVFQSNKNRILLANAASAMFYENCLVSIPSAGRARSHLQTRGMLPRTVKAFAIGYAPDAYFGRPNGPQNWGEGSLVEHLKEKGFMTTEILDAGLATIVKKDLKQLNNQEDGKQDVQIPFSSLMDRFRGRLVVPILDGTGLQVLGFGGRILEQQNDNQKDSSTFVQPKYLNSPETPVFQKKNILFGQHMATKALRFWDKEEGIARAVVIVEGYMDAIALWQAGVREAVASMGTGLTIEQVSAAASLAGSKNGRVIFCLDNDDAGIAAVERLCRSGILSSVTEKYPVEFRVASLPDNIKDPADYMDMFKDEQNLDERFRREVLEKNSLGWMDWYQRNIMSQYNVTAMPGEKGSFADTLDRLGVLLSMTKESSDKKRRFNDMIDSLAASMAVETNVTQVPETIRLQLESELERKTSMNTKWAGSYSLVDETIFRREMGKISEITERVAPSDDVYMESFALPQAQGEGKLRGRTSNSQMPFSEPYHDDTTTFTGSRRFRAKNESPKKKPALTPHFSGFQFQSKHDIGWLDDAELMGKSRSSNTAKARGDSGESLVYFNSNQYHGDQFVTDEALSAGYTNEFVSRDPQLLTKGINALINVKAERILALAEDDLLRLLLNFPAARVSLPRIMDISRSSGSHELINWTMPEKEWLFECLISDDPALTSFGRGNLVDFRAYLACQEGALPGVISNFNDRTKNDAAMQGSTDYGSDKQDVDDENETIVFSTEAEPWQRKGSESKLQGTLETSRVDVSPVPTNMQSETVLHQGQSGKLDHFFHDFPSQEYDFAFASDEKAELRVQETYFTLLWSSSILRLSRKQEEMTLVAVKSLSADKPALLDDTMENMTICTNKAMILDSDEDDKYQSFRADIQKATEQVRLFSDTLRGLSSRLVTKAMPEEGSLTNKWHDDYSGLCARLTKHMQELDSWSIPDEEEINDDDTYETTLERAQVEWGDLYEDDQIWSSNDVVPVQSVPPGGIGLVQTGDDKESIDVFSQRINQDWGWLEEWTPVPQQRDENAGPYEFDEQEWDRYFLGDS